MSVERRAERYRKKYVVARSCAFMDMVKSSEGSTQDQLSPWAVAELGSARLGDARRTSRLLRIVSATADQPEGNLPLMMKTWTDTRAAYEFFDNPNVDAGAILAAHYEQTAIRAAEHDAVLVVHDTTTFNFTDRASTRGLGPLGETVLQGFLMHSALCVSTSGTPLGLLACQLVTRSWEKPARAQTRSGSIPIEQKESNRWPVGMRLVERALPTHSRVVHVMDREGDIYEVFQEASRLGHDVLVRSCQNRRLHDKPHKLWQEEENAPIAGVIPTQIPRSGARKARQAQLEVRYAQVDVSSPSDRRTTAENRVHPFRVNVVFAREIDPPAGQTAIHWKLVTTLPITSTEDALRILEWYKLRWRIESYHFTLKSGCRVEDLQLEDAANIHRALAVYCVVAWHLQYLTHHAREQPNEPATNVLTPAEIKVLHISTPHLRKKAPAALTLHEAVRSIALMGGFLGRKSDGEPGVETIWRGWSKLQDRVRFLDDITTARQDDDRTGE